MRRTNKTLPVAVVALLWAAATQAGPLDEAKAKAHLAAVAAGDVDAIMRDYTDDAHVDWVGGPLDGRYRGKAELRAMWEKFVAANAGKPRPAKFAKFEAYAHPQGTTVEGKAAYGGVPAAKVWHVMTYRDGALTTEIWQITPALRISR